MSTQLTYRASVKLKGYDSIDDAIVDAAVQEARRRVFLDRRWSWLEASSAALSTVVGTSTVSLAAITDLAHIDAVRLSNASGPVPLEWRPRSIIRDLQDRYGTALTFNGCPQFWTRIENKLVFWPTPQQVYTITVEYAKAAADLAASPAVDAIPDKNQDLVVYAACVPLAFRQRDFNASSAADQFYTKVLLPQHAGQDAVEQTQTSEQIRTGYWSY